MGRLLVIVGALALVLLFIGVMVTVTVGKDARKADMNKLRAEADAAEKALGRIQSEVHLAAAALVPIDPGLVQIHLDGYHARVRELYRKEPRT